MSTSDEVKMITRGSSTVVSSLLRGSVVLAGRLCRCLPRLAALGPAVWAMACRDAAATDEKQQRAFEAAVAAAQKAKDPEPNADDIPRVSPVRRPAGEALGFLAVGSLVGFGVVGTVFSVTVPRLLAVIPQGIGPYVAAAAAVGWTAAALAVAPPLPADVGDDQEQPKDAEDAEDAEPAPDRGTALLLHVVGALAEAEGNGRAGVHLDVVLDSAAAAGLLAEGTEVGDLRTWVEGCGLPVETKLGMRIEGKPVTRVGLRVDAATTALGMTPAALLAARSQVSVQTPGETPSDPARVSAQAVGERPAEAAAGTPAEAPVPTPASAPASAVLRLIPGGLLDPESTPSPALSKGRAQETR
ncbi:hypothetical protein [Streptomyces chryseus]|uniref:Uncharacterized protein n=1 Tax=Streptomyces chryseus TaxID=68186 RepID=A0ABQ3EHP2_9ACTN|nr:hypothetical protein [Streptomyces chryseus]GHB31131.1 hypothetical protein GCM10010346_63140 [Streptomyces chryseus]